MKMKALPVGALPWGLTLTRERANFEEPHS